MSTSSERLRLPVLSLLGLLWMATPVAAEEVLAAVFPPGGPYEKPSACSLSTTGRFTLEGVGEVTVRARWTSPFKQTERQRAERYATTLWFDCSGACKDYAGYAPTQIGNLNRVVEKERNVAGEPDGWVRVYDRTDARRGTFTVWIGSVCVPRQNGTHRIAEEFHVWVETGPGLTLTAAPVATTGMGTGPIGAAGATDTVRPGPVVEVAKIANGGAVVSGPTAPTRFTLARSFLLARITTYHWNDGRGASPGTIGLIGDDGRRWGPWPATGKPGSGASNVNWVAEPAIPLPAGTYTVVDSDPSSWSQNGETGGAGFVWVEGAER